MPPLTPPEDDHRRGLADRPGRVLVLIFGAVITIALLAAGTFNVVSAIAHDEAITAVSFPGSVRHVRFAVGNGDVTVVGRSGSEREGISGTRTVSRGLTSPTFDERVEGDTLTIDSSCAAHVGWCSVSYSISVPVDVTVTVESGSGDVTVQGVTADTAITSSSGDVRADSVGALVARATSGDLTVAGATGRVELTTRSGDISASGLSGGTATVESSSGDVDLQFSTDPMSVEARSSSGDVSLIVPADGAAYRVAIQTSSGHESVAVKQDPSSEHRLSATTSSGDIRIFATR
jgi:hypothetical protein